MAKKTTKNTVESVSPNIDKLYHDMMAIHDDVRFTLCTEEHREFYSMHDGKRVTVNYERAKKHYNRETKTYDVLESLGCVLSETKTANELMIRVSNVRIYATPDKEGKVNFNYTLPNTHGCDDSTTTFKKNMREHGFNEALTYIKALGMLNMNWDTLKNIYYEGAKNLTDVYKLLELVHPMIDDVALYVSFRRWYGDKTKFEDIIEEYNKYYAKDETFNKAFNHHIDSYRLPIEKEKASKIASIDKELTDYSDKCRIESSKFDIELTRIKKIVANMKKVYRLYTETKEANQKASN